MKVRAAITRAGLSARLAVAGWSTVTILVSAAVSACSAGTPSPSFSPGTSSPTPAVSASGTAGASASASTGASASASPPASPAVTPTPSASATPSPAASKPPTAAPATGGGGTAGLQDTLLLALGAAAVLAGAASLAYRRRIIRRQ